MEQIKKAAPIIVPSSDKKLKFVSQESIVKSQFEMKLNTSINRFFNSANLINLDHRHNHLFKKIFIVLVDDEPSLRVAMKRQLINHYKDLNRNIDLVLIEATDGIECILALYLANLQNIKISAIISDETMKYLSGNYSAKIIHNLIVSKSFDNVPIFICTGLSGNANGIYQDNSTVKKVFSKPLDKYSISELMKMID